jgi:hypothetical protein
MSGPGSARDAEEPGGRDRVCSYYPKKNLDGLTRNLAYASDRGRPKSLEPF